MREPPKLSDTLIKETLLTHYGLSIQSLSFLPIGNDSATFVYQAIATESKSYFLKVRAQKGFSPASLLIPHFLFEQGVPHIVRPLPTLAQDLWAQVNEFFVILYPFLETRTAHDAGLSDAAWIDLGKTLRQIHTSPLPAELQTMVPREAYIPWRRNVLDQLKRVIHQTNLVDSAQLALQAFWHAHQAEIYMLIEHSDQLAGQLRQRALPPMLCHADIHTWNVLVDTAQQIWIVDWDEVMLAPKERDLMFVIGGIAKGLVSPHQTACFLQGYGGIETDSQVLAYYRYAWAVQEMGAYAEEVFFTPERSEAARHDAVNQFINVFAPGNIASLALESEIGAPASHPSRIFGASSVL